MNTIAEFILEKFNFVNFLIKRENRHNTQLMKGILSYIEFLELLAVAKFVEAEIAGAIESQKVLITPMPSALQVNTRLPQ